MLLSRLQHARAGRLERARPLLCADPGALGRRDDDAEESERAPRPPPALLTFGDAVGLRRRLSAPATPPGHAPMDGVPARFHRVGVSTGFAASALVHRATFASSAPEPATRSSTAPSPPPFPLGSSGASVSPSVADARDASSAAPKDAAATAPADPAASDQDLKVDLHALDRAKAEIDRLHLERQIKEAVSTWNKAVQAWASFKSMGPYLASCARMSRAEWLAATRSSWSHFKEEMAHYWAGTKLLWVEIKIATRLLFKTLRGEPLTRRERRQMTRTTADVFRLVPFAAFVLIPFMEAFLPLAIKLFPGMLPSTFRDELKHEEELKKRLKAKLEVARFLQDTVRVMAKGLKQSRSGYTREKADKLYDFMKKVRSGDATVNNDDVVQFAKLFGDEFTLDHISRGQLTGMCKFVGLSAYGTDSYLRRQLRDKLRELKNDDKVIKREGVASLSVAELQSVSRARGMRADTDDRAILERQINDWLELSLNAKLPPSLLILSRAFAITREASAIPEEAPSGAGDVSWSDESVDELAAKERQAAAMKDIQETLATLPEEVVISVTEERQMASNRKEEVARKLEFLEQEEELIEEEIAERKLEEDALREKAEKEAADAAALAAEKVAAPEMAFDVHADKRETTAETRADKAAEQLPSAPAPPAPAPERPKPTYESIDSVSLDEVESVVAGRRAKRAAKLSRLLAALAGVSSLSVERKELMLLVRKELSSYGKRLRQVQVQLERLDGDAAVAAAVAAEGDLPAATAIEAHAAAEAQLLRARAEERLDADEEERLADESELVPDESEELVAADEGGRGGSDEEEDERMPDPFEVVDDESAEEEADDVEKPGWFRANYDAQLCDRVTDRVNRMLASVKKDLDAADGKIGEKLHVLDTDNDGRISLEELTRVGGVLAEELDDEDHEELRGILEGLNVDEHGRIDVEELSALVSEMIEREFSDVDDHDDLDEEDKAKAEAVIEAIRSEANIVGGEAGGVEEGKKGDEATRA